MEMCVMCLANNVWHTRIALTAISVMHAISRIGQPIDQLSCRFVQFGINIDSLRHSLIWSQRMRYESFFRPSKKKMSNAMRCQFHQFWIVQKRKLNWTAKCSVHETKNKSIFACRKLHANLDIHSEFAQTFLVDSLIAFSVNKFMLRFARHTTISVGSLVNIGERSIISI